MDTYRFRKQIHKLPGKVIHAVPLPEPEVTEEHGSRRQIGEICRNNGYRQVLIVTDRTLSALGYEKAIIESLEAAQVGYAVFNDINSEPTIAIIEAGRKAAQDCGADCIIALGGGSVMDSCKMIAASVKMPHLPVKALLLKFLPVRGGTLPLINVPSTAGTDYDAIEGAGFTESEIREIVATQRNYFRTGATLPVRWRIKQLKKLKAAVIAHEQEFEEALAEDLGRSRVEAYLCDIGPIITEINEMLSGLRRWARPECHFSGFMCFPSMVTKVYKMPYGVSLVISPFNFPILLTIGVVAAAMAGGNTVVVKSSSKSAASTAVLKRFFAEVFPPEYVTLIDGGHDVADMCLAQRFDKIFYTGSPSVGKHVLAEAAKNLTPVALELGGETGNWCVVRKDADLRDAARKIAFFKLCNAGQICININQIAVAEEVAEPFLEELKKAFVQQIGEHPESNPEYPKLITDGAYDKCAALADEYRDRIVFGGVGDLESRRYAPTMIYPVSIDEHIVQHELFCPLLPIVPFKDAEVNALMETIADREHPLAMYLFTNDMKWARRVMRTQQYGGGCINEVCIHMMVKGVPFNGTGHSGMGAYHGIWGFREFTHPQTVLRGSTRFNLSLREHPYGDASGETKLKILRIFER